MRCEVKIPESNTSYNVGTCNWVCRSMCDMTQKAYEPLVVHRAWSYIVLGVFLFPSKDYPQHQVCQYLFIHLGMKRGTVRVKCLAQEHNTMFLARAWLSAACSGAERTKHEATMPPTVIWRVIPINTELGQNTPSCSVFSEAVRKVQLTHPPTHLGRVTHPV